jgi:hypothetical protein
MVFRRLVTYGEEDVYGEAPEDVSKWVGGVTSFNGGVELVGELAGKISGFLRLPRSCNSPYKGKKTI